MRNENYKLDKLQRHSMRNPAAAAAAAAAAKSLQLCQILCNPIDGRPPGSSVPGILQANLEHCNSLKAKILFLEYIFENVSFIM